MRRLPIPRFAASVAAILVVVGLVQLIGSLLFYQSIDRQTLSDDHARRVAELLVVSDRIHALDPDLASTTMSTRHLGARVSASPAVAAPARDETVARIARRIVEWEPGLAGRALHLATSPAGHGRTDLVGSIRLADGRWLNFRSRDISSMWPVALRASMLTLATTIALIGIGLAALHVLARPLRRLADAAEAIGQGRRADIDEAGSTDLRNLAHAMNVMQDRIARLLQDQARSFEAISHDLRTPLSRQKIAGELIEDAELSAIVLSSVDEMEGLLASLQRFLRAQHVAAEPMTVELGAFVRDVLAPFGAQARLAESPHAVVHTLPEPLALALAALVENAIRFGDRATVSIAGKPGQWRIAVGDAGPGIPPRYFEAILDPFFRLDEARARDTRGFGLGIPTAHVLMMRFNGRLAFANAPDGSLIASLHVPELPPAA